MPKAKIAHTWAEFLNLTGCSSHESMENTLVEYVDFDIDEAWAIVTGSDASDHVEVQLGSSQMQTANGNRIDFPFAVDDFWAMIDDLDADNAEKMEHLDLLTIEDLDDSPDLIAELSGMLLESQDDLVYALGGGWISVDDLIPHEMRGASRWYAAGDPPLIVLGVRRNSLTLAGGSFLPAGLDGPPRFEARVTHEFERRGGLDLEALKEATDDIIRGSRRRLKLCRGCRQLTEHTITGPGRLPLCRACAGAYFGTIVE